MQCIFFHLLRPSLVMRTCFVSLPLAPCGGMRERLSAAVLVNFFVDGRYLTHPGLPLFVFHLQNIVQGPMEMVGDVRYLLVKAIQGVAQDSPGAPPIVTSWEWPHSGHVMGTLLVPSSLTCR